MVHDERASGIETFFADAVQIQYNHSNQNGLHGIVIQFSNQVSVEDNEASNKARINPTFSGIRLTSSAGVTAVHDRTDGNGRGIGVSGSTKDIFSRNAAFGNSRFDLDWDAAGTQAFADNKCETANPSTTVRDRT